MKVRIFKLATVAAAVIALAGGGALSSAAAVDPTGCFANDLGRVDDSSSTAVPLPFPVDFFGTTYNSLFVNNNGNVTFDAPLLDYTPAGMPNLHRPLIAPFFADVDTRHPGSGTTHYGQTTVGGAPAFCVLWDGVGYYNTHSNRTNSFQLLLVDRSDRASGDFDIVLNYDRIEWETGDADSGVDGLGGLAAEVGFTNADQHFSMIGSQQSGSFLDTNPAGLVSGSFNAGDVTGRYVFRVRSGNPGLGYPVSGVVRAADGSIVPDTLLQLCPTGGGGEACLTTNSRSDGAYTFVDVTDGTWNLVAFPTDRSTLDRASSSGIQVSGGPVIGRDITLPDGPPAPAVPNGSVQTAAGDPIADATVTVLAAPTPRGPFVAVPSGSTVLAPGQRTNPSTTDATGGFAFDALAGYYKVQAEKPGCWSAGDPTVAYAESPLLTLPPRPAGLVLKLECPTSPPDTTPPVIDVPATTTVPATSPAGAVVFFTVTATDDVDGPVPVTCEPASGATFAIGTTTVHCSAADAAGNPATAQFDVVVTVPPDTTAPTITASGLTKEATGPLTRVDYTFDATDPDDAVATKACAPEPGSLFAVGSTPIHCTATDSHGNAASADFAVVVTDTTPPLVTVPPGLTFPATSAAGAVVAYPAAAAVDLVDGPLTPTCSPSSGSLFPVGTTTVTCTATDAHANLGTASFDLVVTPPPDLTAPTITAANLTEEATGPLTRVDYTFEATDPDDVVVSKGCAPAPGSEFAVGSTPVHCTATDSHGNTGTADFAVVVSDTTAPLLSLPGTVSKQAASAGGATVDFDVSAVDLVDGSVVPLCSRASGDLFPVGTTTVDCTATDAHHNVASGSFDVVVTPPPDLTAPTITAANLTKEATGPLTRVDYTFEATDPDDAVVSKGCAPAPGSEFAVGSTPVHCTATDSHGNTVSADFVVVVTDTTAPTLTLPADITKEATSPEGVAVSFDVSAADLVDGLVAPVCSKSSGDVFPVGTTTVDCTATDAHHNVASGSFDVVVTPPPDLTAPTITAANLTKEASGPLTRVDYTFDATDPDDTVVSKSCLPAPGSEFAVGSTPVHCTATDEHGNTGSADFVVMVTDTTAPQLTLPAPVTAEATSNDGASVAYDAAAHDLVDGPVAVVCSWPSGAIFPLGRTTVDCTAADSHGNRATGSFTVDVVDTTPPVLSLPASITKPATSADGAVVAFDATATDVVDGTVAVTCSPASGSTFPLGKTAVACTATDAHGNVGSGQFDVTIVSAEPPTVTVPAGLSVDATSPRGAVVTFSATATDAVDGALATTCSPASGATFPIGDTTVQCSATNSRGVTGSATFAVHVKGAAEQLADLLQAVVQKKLGPGFSLQAKLTTVILYAASQPPRVTCPAMLAFDKEVRAQAGKALPAADANWLLANTSRIETVLGC